MKYKVLIKKNADPERAARIAEEVAKWSGSSPAVVAAALMQKAVCVKKEAEDEEAMKLKKQFEAVGAEVELEKLAVAAAPPPPPPPKKQAASGETEEYDDEDAPGRVLSEAEYTANLAKRSDIFAVEKDSRLRNMEIVSLVLGILFGVWLSTREIVKVATDFFEKIPEERVAKLVKELPETIVDKQKEKEDEIKTDKKKLKKTKKKGAGGRTGGGGDPRARVTKKGVLGIISGQIKGKTVASADVFGKGGFASGIDAILQGVGGLKA
ncbi:MAG: hypothetical protein GF350_03735, partial [Chitinivibrionales bacterium]|nr:hypothetical protein [Chitinivibrionales bacterium]